MVLLLDFHKIYDIYIYYNQPVQEMDPTQMSPVLIDSQSHFNYSHTLYY